METWTEANQGLSSLWGLEGIVHTHEEIANILSQRFFAQTPPRVEQSFPDDPLPQPTWPLPPIDKNMIMSLLNKVANQSALGHLGHTWTLLKWTWNADPKQLLNLLSACLRIEHNP